MNEIIDWNSKVAVLCDVNANLEALNAVISDVDSAGIKQILFLGDSVGYGPNPLECIQILRERSSVYVRGRFESILTLPETVGFNPHARNMLEWTKRKLENGNHVAWLSELNTKYQSAPVLAVHNLEYYSLRTLQFQNLNNNAMSSTLKIMHGFDVLLLGDNHEDWYAMPNSEESERGEHVGEVLIKKNMILSVGSVGLSRTLSDKRACYLILDNNIAKWRYIDYDRNSTYQKAMSEECLAKFYAVRFKH